MKDLNRLQMHKLTVYYRLSTLCPSAPWGWLVTRAGVRTLSHPPIITWTEKSEPNISTFQASSVSSQRTFIRAAVSRLFKPRFTYRVGILKGRRDERMATPPKKFLRGHVTTWVRLSSQSWIPYQVTLIYHFLSLYIPEGGNGLSTPNYLSLIAKGGSQHDESTSGHSNGTYRPSYSGYVNCDMPHWLTEYPQSSALISHLRND